MKPMTACPVCDPELFDATLAEAPAPRLCIVHADHPVAQMIRERAEMEWHVFQVNDCDWWLAPSLEEACIAALIEYGGDREMIEGARQLTEEELDKVKFRLDEWECGCGLKVQESSARCCQSDMRWNGRAWEHQHDYPAGHVEMRKDITFREQLERRIKEGPEIELFASTEF